MLVTSILDLLPQILPLLLPRTAILWLNGNSKDTLLQSLAAFGKHIPTCRPLEPLVGGTSHAPDVEAEGSAVPRWLALKRNSPVAYGH